MDKNYKLSTPDDLHLAWSRASILSRGYDFYYYDHDYCEESDSDVYVEVLSTIVEEDEDNLSTTTRGSGLARGSEDVARNLPLRSMSNMKGSAGAMTQESGNFGGKLELNASESSILARASKTGGLFPKTNIIPDLPPLEEMLKDVIGKHPRLLSQSGSLTDIPDDSSDNTWDDSSGDDKEVRMLYTKPICFPNAGSVGMSIEIPKEIGAGGDGVDVGHIKPPIVDCNTGTSTDTVKEAMPESKASSDRPYAKGTVGKKPAVLPKKLVQAPGKIKLSITNRKAANEQAVKRIAATPKPITPRLAPLSKKVCTKRETPNVNEQKISKFNETVRNKKEIMYEHMEKADHFQEKLCTIRGSSSVREQKSNLHENIRTTMETSQTSDQRSPCSQEKVCAKRETLHVSERRISHSQEKPCTKREPSQVSEQKISHFPGKNRIRKEISPYQEKTRTKREPSQVSEHRISHFPDKHCIKKEISPYREKNGTKREPSQASGQRIFDIPDKNRIRKEISHANEQRTSHAQDKSRTKRETSYSSEQRVSRTHNQREKSSIRKQKSHPHEKIHTTKDTSLAAEPKRKVESKRITENYKCPECSLEFSLKSLLGAHVLRHEETRTQKKANGAEYFSGNLGHQCTYCNRVFALSQVLHVHLLHHCEQIPLAQRRRLLKIDHEHNASSAAHPRTRSNARANPSTPA